MFSLADSPPGWRSVAIAPMFVLPGYRAFRLAMLKFYFVPAWFSLSEIVLNLRELVFLRLTFALTVKSFSLTCSYVLVGALPTWGFPRDSL